MEFNSESKRERERGRKEEKRERKGEKGFRHFLSSDRKIHVS
jgi:hypothetical protein